MHSSSSRSSESFSEQAKHNTSAFTDMNRLQGILKTVKMQHKMFNEGGGGIELLIFGESLQNEVKKRRIMIFK